MKAKLNVAISLLGYAEEEAADLQITIASLKRQLSEVESQLVGSRERIRNLREYVRTEASKEVHEEVSSREVEILRMKGYTVVKGDTLTSEIKELLRG